jgi:histidine triad (HIT) family protein
VKAGAAECVFCKIVARLIPADIVAEDSETIAFLDSHPLFAGHVLLCPREHVETLADLPQPLAGPMMLKTQLLAQAVERATAAEGTFIAVNNRVSQTVPHLHVHVVPRRRGDGLRGFFWPRRSYRDEAERKQVREAIAKELERLSAQAGE